MGCKENDFNSRKRTRLPWNVFSNKIHYNTFITVWCRELIDLCLNSNEENSLENSPWVERV